MASNLLGVINERSNENGTAGFECNGPYAGPLFYRTYVSKSDRIDSYWLLWTGKHYGKQARRGKVAQRN
jgi:hypothetical protein